MRRWLSLAVLSLVLGPLPGLAVERDDFLIADTQDVVDVCTVPESDPLYTAAISFCHGYLLGAYQYHVALFGHGTSKPVVCLPDPPPTRTQAVDRFVAWVKANPSYAKEKPADSLTKFLVETWPCPKPATDGKTGAKR